MIRSSRECLAFIELEKVRLLTAPVVLMIQYTPHRYTPTGSLNDFERFLIINHLTKSRFSPPTFHLHITVHTPGLERLSPPTLYLDITVDTPGLDRLSPPFT